MSKKLTYKFVSNYFEEQGCELLEESYVDAHQKMIYICVCKNKSEINWNNFKNGQRCKTCGKINQIEKQKLSQKEVADIFQQHGCNLLGTYINSKTPVEYQCICGRKSKITLYHFRNGGRCGCKKRNQNGSNNNYWNPNREEVNLTTTIRNRCYRMLRTTLKYTNKKKTDHSYNLLGYTQKELKKHLVNHPNWIEIKNKKWTIDHIFRRF